jgi:hypothetical protein
VIIRMVFGMLYSALSAAALYLLLFWLLAGEPWEDASTNAGGLAIVAAVWYAVAAVRARSRTRAREP